MHFTLSRSCVFSDGIGRTGTLCALMTSLERIKLEDTVNVFTTVRMLRTQRPGMVQTLVSYFDFSALLNKNKVVNKNNNENITRVLFVFYHLIFWGLS